MGDGTAAEPDPRFVARAANATSDPGGDVDRGDASESLLGGSNGVNDPTPLDDVDGRSLRRQRNREAVIRALIDLVREGDLDPNVAKMADRAGVSHRSIFRYFEDLNDLARTAIQTELSDALPEATIPDVGQGSFDHRIEQLITTRLRVSLRTHGLGRVARARATAIPELDRGLAMINDMMRDQIRRHFREELEAMDELEAEHVIAAITALMSFESFDNLVRMQQLSDDDVCKTWRLAIIRLLAPS